MKAPRRTVAGGTTRTFYRPKGELSAAWKFSPKTDINVKLARKVGQLNFFDFLASVDVASNIEKSANPDLVIQAILTAVWCRGSVSFPPDDGEAPQDLHGWLADREIGVAYGVTCSSSAPSRLNLSPGMLGAVT